MTFLLPLLRPMAGVLALLVVLVVSWAYGNHQGDKSGRAVVQQAWDRERAVQLAAAAAASETNRSIELHRAASAQEITRNAELAQDTIRVAAVRVVAAGDGLRVRTATIAATCDRAAIDPAATSAGPPASAPGDLLANVQRRLTAVAGQLAEIADQRGVSGVACAAAYESLAR